MISSTYDSETSLAMGMLRMAQRWGGLSHPVNMMNTSQLRLLQPADSTAPQTVHLITESTGRHGELQPARRHVGE